MYWKIKRTLGYVFSTEWYHQLKSALRYFRRGWSTYDFDSAFALRDFIWKLGRVEKAIENGHLLYRKRKSAQIRRVIVLLNRVLEDDYIEEFDKEVTEKYGDSIHYQARTDGIWGFTNKGKGLFRNSCVGSISFHRREKWTPENHYEIEKAERRKYVLADKKRAGDWRKALKIIEKDFWGWWD